MRISNLSEMTNFFLQQKPAISFRAQSYATNKEKKQGDAKLKSTRQEKKRVKLRNNIIAKFIIY